MARRLVYVYKRKQNYIQRRYEAYRSGLILVITRNSVSIILISLSSKLTDPQVWSELSRVDLWRDYLIM